MVLHNAILRGVARGHAVGNVRTASAGGVDLELSRAVAASDPRSAVICMNAAAMKSTGVETVKSARVETTTVKSTSVKSATTVEAASVETTTAAVTAAATVTTTAVTAATSRISQVGERCCNNRGRNDRDKRQQHIASFEHTTLHHFTAVRRAGSARDPTNNTPSRSSVPVTRASRYPRSQAFVLKV
jgi:hypothetical protein